MLALLILAVWSEPATIRTKGMTGRRSGEMIIIEEHDQ